MKRIFTVICCLFLVATSFVGFPAIAHADSGLPIIIDTDAALDDWVAISYLLKKPGLDIKAITVTSTGESSLADGLMHVGDLTVMAGRSDIPIYGQEAEVCGNENASGDKHATCRYLADEFLPSHRFPPQWSKDIHAGYGIASLNSDQWKNANINLIAADDPSKGTITSASKAIAEIAANADGKVNLVTLGPLTNVARALDIDYMIAYNIDKIYAMGGSIFAKGNLEGNQNLTYATDDHAEWNIFADVGAATRVFDASLHSYDPLIGQDKFQMFLIPLDTTNQIKLTQDFVVGVAEEAVKSELYCELLGSDCNPILQTVNDILQTPYIHGGIEGGWYYLWDPTAAVVAAQQMLNPSENSVVEHVRAQGIGINGSNLPSGTGSITASCDINPVAALYADKMNPSGEENNILETLKRPNV